MIKKYLWYVMCFFLIISIGINIYFLLGNGITIDNHIENHQHQEQFQGQLQYTLINNSSYEQKQVNKIEWVSLCPKDKGVKTKKELYNMLSFFEVSNSKEDAVS